MNPWPQALAARLAAWKAAGLERRLRVAEGSGTHLTLAGRAVVSFASNDYLGLSTDPRVLAAAKAALDAHGAGATASRLICGTKPEHAALEEELARFKRSEAALVFASGYHAALGTLVALLSASNAVVVLDRFAHACLLDGARLSGARIRTFKHNDVGDLRRILERESLDPTPDPSPPAGRGGGEKSPLAGRGGENSKFKIQNSKLMLIAVESLYSMDGDLAPLRELHAVAREAGALLLVDEAHALGVLGPGGRGALAEVFDGALPDDVVSLGTLSKALGSQGGFLCASRPVVETVLHAGRAFLFSTGLAPACAAAARSALAIVERDEELRGGLLARAEALRVALRGQGWKVLGGPGPILPILVGAEREALALSERLMEAGFWVPAVRYPTVKSGQARLRLTLTAAHTPTEIEGLAWLFQSCGLKGRVS